MKTEISAGAVVLRKKGNAWHVLLLKDTNGNWTFPKGLIEKGEEPVAAALREAEEEVGIKELQLLATLSPIHYRYYRRGLIQKTVHYFLFKSIGKSGLKPQKEEGISAVKWVSLSQAMEITGYPKTNKPLLEEAKKNL